MFLTFETADKPEVKMYFSIHVKAWQAWSYYSSKECFYYIECWMEVSVQFEGPAALPPEKEPPLLFYRLLGGLQGQSRKFW